MKKGFTLLEVIIVIIIIGVLTSLALPRLFNMRKQAWSAEFFSYVASLRLSLERRYLMYGSYKGNAASEGTLLDTGLNLLDVEDLTDVPGSYFYYEVWATNDDGYAIKGELKNEFGGQDHRIDCHYTSEQKFYRISPSKAVACRPTGKTFFCLGVGDFDNINTNPDICKVEQL